MKSSRNRSALYCSLLVLLCPLLACHSLAPPVPLAQLNAQQTAGYQVFQTHCGQCHYDRQDDSLHGPALIGIFKKPYLHSGAPANEERVRHTVLHGHNLMPAQPNIDPEDLDNLIAYLHTL